MSKDSEDSGRLQIRTLTSVVDLNASILREIAALLDELTPEYDKLEVVVSMIESACMAIRSWRHQCIGERFLTLPTTGGIWRTSCCPRPGSDRA